MPIDRRQAGPELLVLAKWEEYTGWFFDHTAKWPKSARFALTQRLQTFVPPGKEVAVLGKSSVHSTQSRHNLAPGKLFPGGVAWLSRGHV